MPLTKEEREKKMEEQKAEREKAQAAAAESEKGLAALRDDMVAVKEVVEVICEGVEAIQKEFPSKDNEREVKEWNKTLAIITKSCERPDPKEKKRAAAVAALDRLEKRREKLLAEINGEDDQKESTDEKSDDDK